MHSKSPTAANTSSTLEDQEHDNKTTEDINSLFSTYRGRGSYKMLIEGESGMGKTILSSEIAAQWADKVLLDDKILLFLLFMRQPKTKNISNVKSLVEHFFHDDIPLVNEITEWLINSNGKHLTIILDGYDEASRYSAFFEFVNQLIAHETLPECGLVITSRPAESLHLHGHVNCRAELLGFTEESRQQFIMSYIKKQEEKRIYQTNKLDVIECNIKKKIKIIQQVLKRNANINMLCYVPLNATMLLLCLTESEEEIDLPSTATSLYERFIIITIKHFLCTKPGFTGTMFSFKDLPHEYYQTFQELTKFAYSASIDMDDNKCMQLVFELADIEKNCENFISHGNGLGLLKPASFLKMEIQNKYSSYSFLHKSIQEYMAAYHIASLPPVTLSSLLTKKFWDSSFFSVWVMYVGITGGDQRKFKQFLSGSRFKLFTPNPSKISNKILNDKIKCLHLLHCAIEAQESKFLLSIQLIFKEKVIDLSNKTLSETEIKTLAVLLISLPGGPWTLNLSRCNINNKCCKVFFEMFASQTVIANIKTVDISFNSISSENLFRLCHEIFKSWKTKEVILPIDALHTSVTIKEVEQFKSSLHSLVQIDRLSSGKLLISSLHTDGKFKLIVVYSNMNYVTCFPICGSELNENMAKTLQEIVRKKLRSHKVGQIYFSYSIYKHHDVETLSYIVENFQQIKFIGLNMHSKGAYLLTNASKIDFQNEKDPSTSLVDILAAIVQNNSQRNTSTSYFSMLSRKVKKDTTEILRNISTVKVLDLVNNNVSDCVADDIEFILASTKLEELYLGRNTLQQVGIIKIAKALRDNSTLKVFDISNNDINIKAANSIADSLANKYKLEQLFLNGNALQTEGIIRIINKLQSTSLKVFNISQNNIRSIAASSIANLLVKNTELEELLLGDNILQTEGIIKIIKGLRNTTSLKVFDISNNDISSKAANDIAYVLSKQVKLENVNLGRNNLQDDLIIIVKKLNHYPNLKVLDIHDNNATTEIAHFLAAFLCCQNKLEKLYLGGNDLVSIEMLQALQRFSGLTALDISWTNVSDKVKEDISCILARNTKLQELNLGGNKLSFSNIAGNLFHIRSLEYFNVSNSSICDKAADSIADIISNNTGLQELHLSKNSLETEGICIVMKAIKQHINTLRVLDISNNHVSEEAVEEIKMALSININLQELYLSDTNLLTNGAIEVAKGLKTIVALSILDLTSNEINSEAANDIGDTLSKTLKLQKLYLGMNNLQTAGIITVARDLQFISELKILDISYNNIDVEAADYIATALSNKFKLEQLYLGGNNLQAESIIKIINSIQNTSILKIFDISRNKISGEAASKIEELVLKTSQLEELYIDGNALTVQDNMKIANGLLNTLSLKIFKVSNNTSAVDESAHHQDTYTLLHEAASKGHLKVLKLLLRLGSDVDCCTNNGCTPLQLAIANGHMDCVQVLLLYNADVRVTDEYGKSPVQVAELKSCYSLVKMLKSAGKQM